MNDLPGGGRTILIVDDEPEAAAAVARYFRPDRGWRSVTAHSGEAALARINASVPDVAVIDIRMPGMNGIETLKRLREKAPQCVVVMLTAVDEASVALETLREGAADYLRKPVILRDLEHTILSAIEKERLRRENLDYQNNLEAKVAEQTASLTTANVALSRANLEIVAALTDAIEAKDLYTRGHSHRVALYAVALGRASGVYGARLRAPEVGALLHDIGKIGVSDNILHAPRSLTDEEFVEVRRHPEIGVQIIGNVGMLCDALDVIRHHHEQYGGGGYPDGLVGEEIDLLARIVGVADVFDALTSDRPYRAPFDSGKALAILREMAGTQLDPGLVELFIAARVYRLEEA